MKPCLNSPRINIGCKQTHFREHLSNSICPHFFWSVLKRTTKNMFLPLQSSRPSLCLLVALAARIRDSVCNPVISVLFRFDPSSRQMWYSDAFWIQRFCFESKNLRGIQFYLLDSDWSYAIFLVPRNILHICFHPRKRKYKTMNSDHFSTCQSDVMAYKLNNWKVIFCGFHR